MKKTFLYFNLCLAMAVMVSCKPSSKPSVAAEEFSKAMLNDDFAKAKTFVVKESEEMLDQGETMSKQNPMPDSIKALIKDAKITSSNEKILNDTTATVDITTTLKQEIMGRKENKETFVLKKEGGVWKVDMIATVKKVMEESAGNQMQGEMPADSAAYPAAPDSSKH